MSGPRHSGTRPVPSQFLGVFIGLERAKPFQRKRANLSTRTPGKLPSLAMMQAYGEAKQGGPDRTVPLEESRRVPYALDYVHDGANTFAVTRTTLLDDGASEVDPATARLVLDAKGIVFAHDVNQHEGRVLFPYSAIEDWLVTPTVDVEHAQNANWLAMSTELGHDDVAAHGLSIRSDGREILFAVPEVHHLRDCLEHNWNKSHAEARPGSVHGRTVQSLHTLTGLVKHPHPPIGSIEMPNPSSKHASAKERASVRTHWNKVVKHNGWLTAFDGEWRNMYCVLYQTSLGHFFACYDDVWNAPLYSATRSESSIFDISKVAFLRAQSTMEGTPTPFAFDISSVDATGTFCAVDHETRQQWLQMLASACDEDVAIMPDNFVEWLVTFNGALDGPKVLRIGAWGIVVLEVPENDEGPEPEPILYFDLTQILKWSVTKGPSGPGFRFVHAKSKVNFSMIADEAAKIASTVEHFIERFLDRMHLWNEVLDQPVRPTNPAPAAAAAAAEPANSATAAPEANSNAAPAPASPDDQGSATASAEQAPAADTTSTKA